MTVQFDEEKQNKKVEELRKAEEENLAKMLSAKYGVGYIDLTPLTISPDGLKLITEETARTARMAVFGMIGKRIQVAVQSPQREETQTVLRDLEGRGFLPAVHLVSMQSLEKAWGRYKDLSYAYETRAGGIDISNEEIRKILQQVKTIDDVRKDIQLILEEKKGYRISRMFEIMLAGAIATKASDIHIEPEEENVRLRYRLDGVLTDLLYFDTETYALLLSRLKLLSGMKLNLKGSSQDGRFSVSIDESDVEIRASILPGAYNESVVLRILNPNAISVPMEDLGIEPRLLKILEHEIRKPNGMILTTGPTGSGKTTTLYAFMKKIHTPDIKIITIEDPIEYHLPGIVQTQTNAEKGYTFLSGLRSALRQDPDVMMVGEIRDNETAEIAINSALTGHLVFSTLHTNNAAGSFPRLIDLGVNPKILSSAINVSLAQRLIRKLCDNCKKEVVTEGTAREKILKTIVTLEKHPDYKGTSGEKMWVPVGCQKCNGSGYRGRIGIYEAILMDENIERIIKENPSEREISAVAESQRILTMRQDGVVKVVRGVTSLEELERVIDLESII